MRRCLNGTLLLSLIAFVGCTCSRARVESMIRVNEGVQLAQKGLHEQAAIKLEEGVNLDVTNDAALYNLALVHIELHQPDRAKEDLKRALAIDAEKAAYHDKLATVHMETGDWDAAKKSLDDALKLDDVAAETFFKMAQVQEHLDDPQSALENYTKAIYKDPALLLAYSALGSLYADLDFHRQATEVLQSGIKVKQFAKEKIEVVRLHHVLGTVFESQRRYDDAIEQYLMALKVEPGFQESLFSLGWTYAYKGESDKAREFLERFVQGAGPEVPAHYIQAARDRLASL